MRAWIGAAFALVVASSTVACGAILGFPDQTNADPNFGSVEGGGPDGSTPPDGSVADAPAPTDGSLPIDAPVVGPDGACNCFGGTCNDGGCQAVAVVVGEADPNFIETDNTTVFFASGGQTILAFDPNGADAGVRKVTNVAEPSINDLHAAGGYVYFTNLGGGSMNSVSRCSGSKGCALDRSEYGVSNRKNYGVAVSGNKVYFSVSDLQGANGGLWSCTQTGCAGSTRILPRDYPGLVVTNGTTVAWLETSNGVGLQESSTTGTGFTPGGDSTIVDLSFGVNSEVYYVKSASLWRQIGSQVPQQFGGAPEVSNALTVRVDGSYVYWINGGNPGSLMRCPLNVNCLSQPKQATALATGLASPFGLTLSNDSVYFTTRADLKVWRLRK